LVGISFGDDFAAVTRNEGDTGDKVLCPTSKQHEKSGYLYEWAGLAFNLSIFFFFISRKNQI
jgi:hypothetical protein